MRFASTIFIVAAWTLPAVAAPLSADHIRVELIADDAALAPGKAAMLGLHLVHEPHWHTYWINPGDSGLPTKVAWHLPDGFSAGEIAWPTPARFAVGDLYNFGYDGDVLLPVKIDVPSDTKSGSNAHIGVDVSWLVCREECVPGKASFSIDLPVRTTAARDARHSKLFDLANARQPQPAAWNGQAHVLGDGIEVLLSGDTIPSTSELDAFVIQRKVAGNAPPKITRKADALMLLFAKSDYFTSAPTQIDLLLRGSSGADVHAWSVTLPLQADHP